MARGEDTAPLVPTLPEERFESSLDLEWPIDGLEPLSFVLTRLLEPLSARLERRDRGAAILHLDLRLITPLRTGVDAARHERHLQLPSPIRDVRTLRTLLLLDLDAHPPPAAVDRVTIVIDPTPGRVVQHTLFTRAHPTPEQLSTLLARLAALMGQDRIGAPATVDSYRPGAFAMEPFATDHDITTINAETAEHAENIFRKLCELCELCVRSCRAPPQPQSLLPPFVDAASRFPRARSSSTGGPRVSRPTAAASPAERCASRPARGARRDIGGRDGREGQEGQGQSIAKRIGPDYPACPAFPALVGPRRMGCRARRRRGVSRVPGSGDRRVVRRCDCGLINMNHGGHGGHGGTNLRF